ncbi:hypothetical protein C0995_016580 [Termitomyces sp. Mi166|nr:hypothetical protein C0995_016580 [Termitomyces sp. Mi166\
MRVKRITSELKNGHRNTGDVYYAWQHFRFPEGTQGFLYCYHDLRLPSTTGEIRFRVTPTSDPASFKNGFDLLRPDGVLPWSVPVLLSKTPFRELAIQESLIDSKTMIRLRKDTSSALLTFLEQPFVISLETATHYVYILTPQGFIKNCALNRFFMNPSNHNLSSLKGKLLVRFEQADSTEPVSAYAIVMRVLKVIEPIEPLVEDNLILHLIPTPGTLMKHFSRGRIQLRTFESPALRLLPSLTGTSPPPSLLHGPEHPSLKSRRTFFRSPTRTISTLDPSRLEPSDFNILSGMKAVYILGRSDVTLTKPARVTYTVVSGEEIPFPPDTHGFFYLHLNPRLPLLSGQIRFRVMPCNDPAQFENGFDLSDANGQPWCLDAVQIAHSVSFSTLKEQLRHGGYTEFMQALSTIPKTRNARRKLYYLEQPFVMDLSYEDYTLFSMLADRIRHSNLHSPFRDARCRWVAINKTPPYTGQIVVRFERSTLPEHAGGNFVVIRVLKILDPVKPVDPHYDNFIEVPRVGELVLNSKRRLDSYDLDTRHVLAGLKDLPSVPDVEPDLTAFVPVDARKVT